MITKEKKRILRSALAAAISAVTIASVTVPVYSAPSAEELEITTSNLKDDLNDLNSQLSSLSAELDNASAQIEQLAAEDDRDMLEALGEVCAGVEKKQDELKAKQDELAAMQVDLNAKKDALTSKISSTSSQLEDYTAQLERARAAEEALRLAQNNAISGSIVPPSERPNNNGNGQTNNNPSNTNSSNNNSSGGTTTAPPTEANVSDVALFAALLECEATGYDPMLAVATVVMNRVASPNYPGSLRGVIYQSGQFAPTWNGSLEKVLARGPSSTAYSVAQAALGGSRHASVINCYQFRSAWTGVSGINIGGNIFF